MRCKRPGRLGGQHLGIAVRCSWRRLFADAIGRGGDRNRPRPDRAEPADDKRPQLYEPYFLYPLQRWAVLDMLGGRLGFLAILNLGRLAGAVEAKGLEVEVRGGDLMAFTTFDLPDGTRLRAGVGGLRSFIVEMVMEARPLDYFAVITQAMSKAARDQYPRLRAG